VPAPQLQPDITEPETIGAHAFSMGRTARELEPDDDEGQGESASPDLNPLRAAGWIFHNGDCIAIERQGEELAARGWAD
jgi:hypothetical protein